MIHGHGDDGYRYARKIRANFSTNVWPFSSLDPLRDHLAAHFDSIGSYPEPAAESLAQLIATNAGVGAEQVIVTNGAVAAIHLVAQVFRGARTRIVIPTFAEHEDACRLHAHAVEFISREQFASEDFSGADLVWLCNPNNPTGEVWSRAELLAIVARHPATRFVVDLAYAELCLTEPLRDTDAQTHPNLILLHSLTKRWAIPGLRLGYIVAAPVIAARLAAAQPPWSVNAFAIEAGNFFLSNGASASVTPPTLAEHLSETARFGAALARVPGVSVRVSATPFFVFRIERGTATAAELKAHLVERHGLLVRDAANFRGLDARSVRVSTLTPEKNARLVEALREWMQ